MLPCVLRRSSAAAATGPVGGTASARPAWAGGDPGLPVLTPLSMRQVSTLAVRALTESAHASPTRWQCGGRALERIAPSDSRHAAVLGRRAILAACPPSTQRDVDRLRTDAAAWDDFVRAAPGRRLSPAVRLGAGQGRQWLALPPCGRGRRQLAPSASSSSSGGSGQPRSASATRRAARSVPVMPRSIRSADPGAGTRRSRRNV